ncbi:MAG: hypothetical protein WCE46_05830 [Methanoregula sp.]|uniref:hypothetical protein n=1 Tax=Methanoregula sp. TaxID=2052170 RepID=UPI003C718C44
MEFNSGITTYGEFRKTWVWEDCQDYDTLAWKERLKERLAILLEETFVESSVSQAIIQQRYLEDFTSNSSTIESTLLALKKHLDFKFPEPAKVISYLIKHRNIFDVVLLGCVLTQEKFGHSAEISLELYSDPEIDDEYLTIYVRQNPYEPNIIKKIDAICEEYMNVLDIDQGYLLVTTDFQRPRE